MFTRQFLSRRAHQSAKHRLGPWPRPFLEVLEDRTLLSVYTVDSLTNTGQGSGSAGDLRYCINQATDGDAIQFAVQGTILARTPSGHPEAFEIAHSIRIDGPGPDQLTIAFSGAPQATGRIFTVDSGATVAISGLSIADGNANGIISDGNGGGILNRGTLTLSNTVFSHNSGSNSLGGGAIFNNGTLTVSYSTFSGNYTIDANGGAIWNGGSLAIRNSMFAGNRASIGGGGAILNAGSLAVSNSMFTGNTAVSGGAGAIYNQGTLTGNRSSVGD